MKQFSEAYPTRLLQQFIQFTSRLNNPDAFMQYPAEAFLSIENQFVEFCNNLLRNLRKPFFTVCKGKNEVLAEYALKGMLHPIGVAEYQLAKAIPEELKSQLPNIADLEQELVEDDK